MSRRKRQPTEEQQPTVKANVAPTPEPSKNGDAVRVVPKARRCPACYEGLGGVGKRVWQTQINGPLKKRGYRCMTCGATWQAEVRTHIKDGVEWITTEIGKVEPDDDFVPDEVDSTA